MGGDLPCLVLWGNNFGSIVDLELMYTYVYAEGLNGGLIDEYYLLIDINCN